MDSLNHILSAGLPWPELFIAITASTIIYLFFTYTVIGNDEESALDIHVPIPEQCKPNWQGTLLNEPSIKVAKTTMHQRLKQIAEQKCRFLVQALYNAIVQLPGGS